MPTAVQGSGARFRLKPDPPVAGKPLEVQYLGPATEIEIQIDGGKPKKKKPDKDGRLVIDPLPAGGEIMITDRLGLEGYLHRKIINFG